MSLRRIRRKQDFLCRQLPDAKPFTAISINHITRYSNLVSNARYFHFIN